MPVAPLSHIVTKNTTSGSGLSMGTKNGVEYFVLPTSSKPANKSSDKWDKDVIVAAIWWTGTTHSKQDANMALESLTQYGIDVLVSRNTKDIPAYARLQYYVPAKKKIVIERASNASNSEAAQKTRKL